MNAQEKAVVEAARACRESWRGRQPDGSRPAVFFSGEELNLKLAVDALNSPPPSSSGEPALTEEEAWERQPNRIWPEITNRQYGTMHKIARSIVGRLCAEPDRLIVKGGDGKAVGLQFELRAIQSRLSRLEASAKPWKFGDPLVPVYDAASKLAEKGGGEPEPREHWQLAAPAYIAPGGTVYPNDPRDGQPWTNARVESFAAAPPAPGAQERQELGGADDAAMNWWMRASRHSAGTLNYTACVMTFAGFESILPEIQRTARRAAESAAAARILDQLTRAAIGLRIDSPKEGHFEPLSAWLSRTARPIRASSLPGTEKT